MIRLRSDDFYDLQMRVPVAYETDILVVGGGPAGTATTGDAGGTVQLSWRSRHCRRARTSPHSYTS